MIECACGQLGKSYEYHSDQCPVFLDARSRIRLERMETVKAAVIVRLVAGDSAESVAFQYGQPQRVIDRFVLKYGSEIEEAKNPRAEVKT